MRDQAVTKEAMERYLDVAQGIDQTIKINNQSANINELQRALRMEKNARTEVEKRAAADKANYESQLATVKEFRAMDKANYESQLATVKEFRAMDKASYESQRAADEEFRAYEKVLHAGVVEQWQLITKILTAPLSIDHAAETVALFKTMAVELKLQFDLTDAYRTQFNRGRLQEAKRTNKYRALCAENKSLHAALAAKDAEIARLKAAGGAMET